MRSKCEPGLLVAVDVDGRVGGRSLQDCGKARRLPAWLEEGTRGS